MQHAKGLGKIRSGEACWNAKLNKQSVLAIKQEVSDGARKNVVAKRYGVSPTTILNVVTNKIWK